MLRRGIAPVALAAALGLALYIRPASAFHGGAPVDCGSAGTFTIKATQTGAPGVEAPFPWTALVFEGGRVLTVFRFKENGQVLINKNPIARDKNSVSEVTCTFSFVEGGVTHNVEVVGVLTP